MRSSGAEGEDSGKHEYCLLALEHLLERADAYTTASQPVRWGWCRSAYLRLFSLQMCLMCDQNNCVCMLRALRCRQDDHHTLLKCE